MKKSVLFRTVCIALTVIMAAFMFAACGSGGSGGENNAKEVKGETKTWGRYTILVPEKMELSGGNVLDPEDPTVVTVRDTDSVLHYVMCTIFPEESCKSSVEGTKESNSGENVTIDINGVTWTGTKYTWSGSDGFSMYAQIDGEWVLASGFYHAYDSEITRAILGSIKVSAAE